VHVANDEQLEDAKRILIDGGAEDIRNTEEVNAADLPRVGV